MRVWISGGSGFVGSHLVRAFDGWREYVGATRNVVAAFDLDRELLGFGPPPEPPFPVPYDTRLDAVATAATLGVELPDLDSQLRKLRTTLEVQV